MLNHLGCRTVVRPPESLRRIGAQAQHPGHRQTVTAALEELPLLPTRWRGISHAVVDPSRRTAFILAECRAIHHREAELPGDAESELHLMLSVRITVKVRNIHEEML